MTEQILIALRMIIRAIDLHSKHLVQNYGLTGPQLLLLHEIDRRSKATASEIAKYACLSNATVTDILDRLEKNGLVNRIRSKEDRRRIIVSLTDSAHNILKKAPSLLQERFVKRLGELNKWEQTLLLSSLQRIAHMMEAEEIDAKPILVSGPLAISEKQTEEFLKNADK